MPDDYLKQVETDLFYLKGKIEDILCTIDALMPESFANLEQDVASVVADLNVLGNFVQAINVITISMLKDYFKYGEENNGE